MEMAPEGSSVGSSMAPSQEYLAGAPTRGYAVLAGIGLGGESRLR
jgi:hypothetical protein